MIIDNLKQFRQQIYQDLGHARDALMELYEHAGGALGGGKPITVGQGYSSIAWIPEEKGSWTLPLSHQRINSASNPLSVGAQQLRSVCSQLSTRALSIWDSEYANASFLKQTADIEADLLMRLRPNRCLWRAAPPTLAKVVRENMALALNSTMP